MCAMGASPRTGKSGPIGSPMCRDPAPGTGRQSSSGSRGTPMWTVRAFPTPPWSTSGLSKSPMCRISVLGRACCVSGSRGSPMCETFASCSPCRRPSAGRAVDEATARCRPSTRGPDPSARWIESPGSSPESIHMRVPTAPATADTARIAVNGDRHLIGAVRRSY